MSVQAAVRRVTLLLALLTFGFAVFVVLPNVALLFSEFKADLPLPTRVLFAVGASIQSYRLQIAAGLTLLALAALLLSGDRRVRRLMSLIESALVPALVLVLILVAIAIVPLIYGPLSPLH